MRVINFIEVTTEDGEKARVHADSVEVVKETKDGLTICTTRVTLKISGETMDSFWEKMKAARGGLESRVFGDECVPPGKRAPAKEVKAVSPPATGRV